MDEFESLSHSKWECKYHVVFIPKCRRKVLYGSLRKHLGEVFRKLAEQKECRIEEGHLLADHVHMMISIPPKYAVSQVVGFIKGKSAIHLARVYGERKTELCGTELLGARVFRVNRGPGRDDHSGLHPQPGEGRRASRPDEHVEIACHRQGGSTQRGRVSDPAQAASSGSRNKAPGSAGGYLLYRAEFDVPLLAAHSHSSQVPMLMRMQKRDAALAEASTALAMDSRSPILEVAMGATLLQLGRVPEANEAFSRAMQKAREHKPDDESAAVAAQIAQLTQPSN